MLVARHDLMLFADYFQFFLEDENIEVDVDSLWTPQEVEDLLCVRVGHIRVGTVRNMTVPVVVEVHDSILDDQSLRHLYNTADHVARASIQINSGKLVVAGNSDYKPHGLRISIAPSTYVVTVYYCNLDALRNNDLDGDDSYTVILHPSEAIPTRIIKRREN